MSNGDLLSLAINLIVGIYFIYFFPRQLKKQMPVMPPLFVWLHRFIPLLGYILIIGSLFYTIYILVGGER